MNSTLWKMDKRKLSKTNLVSYCKFVKSNFKIDSLNDFNKLWNWSIKNPKFFWKSVWDFTNVKGKLGNTIIQDSNIFYKNKFFPDTKLSYAENLLKKNNEDSAII